MRTTRRSLLAAMLLSATMLAGPVRAQSPLTVEAPWARASAGSAANSAAYMTIVNKTNQLDRLLSASANVSEKVELHTHINEGGVMQMRQIQAIEVNPGEPAVLQPGGLHVMLIGLKAPLKAGDNFPLTLTFEKAGKIEVNVTVRAPGAAAMPRGHAKH